MVSTRVHPLYLVFCSGAGRLVSEAEQPVPIR